MASYSNHHLTWNKGISLNWFSQRANPIPGSLKWQTLYTVNNVLANLNGVIDWRRINED